MILIMKGGGTLRLEIGLPPKVPFFSYKIITFDLRNFLVSKSDRYDTLFWKRASLYPIFIYLYDPWGSLPILTYGVRLSSWIIYHSKAHLKLYRMLKKNRKKIPGRYGSSVVLLITFMYFDDRLNVSMHTCNL